MRKSLPIPFKEAQALLRKHKKRLVKLGVQALFLFGSVARGEATQKSDIDILVKFDSKKGLFGFVDLKNYLQEVLECEVDLVTKNALHPALKKKILQEAKNVF
jgi:predicted nucleotidyltransferase